MRESLEKIYGKDNVTITKMGLNYKIDVTGRNKTYMIKHDGTIKGNDKIEKMAETKVYGKLDENNDKILHLRATSSNGYEEIKKVYYGDYSINGSYSGIEKIIIDEPIAPKYITFRGCANLIEIENIENFHTENMRSFNCMFYGCTNLESLDVSHFDTSNVTNMGYIFYNCKKLKSIDLSNFDTDKMTTMENMFGSAGFEELDLSSFNTDNVKSMGNMFGWCSNLKKINLSSFNTKNVTSMGSMFQECSNITELDLNNFDTDNVKSMNSMFKGCSALTTINLSNFNTSNVENMGTMFMGCNKLKELDLSNFDTSKVTYFYCIFYGCNGLRNINLSGKFKINDDANYNGFFCYINGRNGIKIKSTQDTADKTVGTGDYLTITDNFEIVE